MKRMLTAVVLTLLAWAPATAASAQLLVAKDGPIVYGHHHLNASSIDDQKKFWVDALGARVGKFGNNQDIVIIPNALIFMRTQAPKGPTIGSTMNHIGVSVPNLRQSVDRLKAGGFRMVTAQEAPAGVNVVDDIGVVSGGDVSGIAYVLGPDEVKVELIERKAQTEPIRSHHIHFFGQQNAEMRAWYMKVFGAKQREGQAAFLGADLPGIGLNFSQAPGAVAGTQGRALDHIGFEIDNLEAFTKGLEAQGIKLAVPYRKVEALNLAIAFISDPWGTYIELTEGLDLVK